MKSLVCTEESQCRCFLVRTPMHIKNLGQYDRPRVLGCEPVDGVLVVLS